MRKLLFVEINQDALIYALAQQTKSLPTELQTSLTAMGQSLETNDSKELEGELSELIRSYKPLALAYKEGIAVFTQEYSRQKRWRSHTPPICITIEFIKGVLKSNDWVKSVRFLRPKSKKLQFLRRSGRVVMLASGGAFLGSFLGSLIFRVPGAVIGGLLAAFCVLWSSPIKEDNKEKPGIYTWLSFPVTKKK